jgi:hypothetical protein
VYLYYTDKAWRLGEAYTDPGMFYTTAGIESESWMAVGETTVLDIRSYKTYDIFGDADSGSSGGTSTGSGSGGGGSDSGSGDDSGEGDGEDVTGSLIRVTGTPNEVYNGDYQLTELTTEDGGSVYKHINNEAYIYLLQGSWFIYNNYSDYPGSYIYEPDASSTLPVSSSWMNLEEQVISGMKSEVVSSSGDSGSSDGKTYVYTVSGAGLADVNGDYWATGETVKINTNFIDPNDRYNTIWRDTEYPIYTNEKYYIVPNGGTGQWIIDDAVTPNGAPNYRGPFINTGTLSGDVCIANTPADGSWEVLGGTAPAPTVTAYAGGGGNTEPAHDYIATVIGSNDDVAGNYYDSGMTSE